MTPARLALLETLKWKDLRPLCAATGPCVTIMLPAYHPGAAEPSYAVRLRRAARMAEQELSRHNPSSRVEELLEPLQDLAAEEEMSTGGRDMAIFRSPDVFRRFQVLAPIGERVVVARHFYIVPLLAPLCAEREFYILGVSRKHLRLLHYRCGECEEVPVPSAIPRNLEEAGGFDAPDHMLQNRSGAGKSAGSMRAVQFGTGSERETAHDHLFQFFRLVDDGLHGILNGVPLLLAGVEYETAIYRRAARYPHLMHGRLPGDPRVLSIQEIRQSAREIARSYAEQDGLKARDEFREMAGLGRGSTDLSIVLQAAGQGRVAKLILRLGEAPGSDLAGGADPVNAAAVETISHGGEVCMLAAAQMAGFGGVAAIFRY